jgi:hypothetical protein
MAVNVSVFDLVNYPNNPKTVTVDITELVPYGNGGEDTWVFSAITTATASGGAAIQRIYISQNKVGWAKSSGLKQGPYTVNASQKHLKIAIDEDIGSAVEITLDENAVTIGGNAVAKDIQAKLSATAMTGGDKAGNLAYLNAVCRFVDGAFEIVSGTTSDVYTGSTRSSVAVADGTSTTGLAAELGFDITFTSEELASNPPVQTSLAAMASAAATSLTVTTAGVVAEGDAIAITDGVNTEYRGVESSIGSIVTISSGIDNGYAAGSMVQVLTMQDPAGKPVSAYETLDDVVKFSIASLVNQIDFSS